LSTAAGQTAFLAVGAPIATGVHQVDSPVYGGDGTLYLTYSGSRGDRSPVSIFRVRRDGFLESFVAGITNPTSMAVAPSGRLHVSSRFDGTVVAVDADGTLEPFVSELGVACGLAFDPDGTLYVGDRSGTIFRVSSAGEVAPFATLPPSVAAFHLAMGPTGDLYVTAPTLSTHDAVYRVDQGGSVTTVTCRFGRPQGLAFDGRGVLHVVEALAGASGVYRLRSDGEVELVVAAPGLVGLAFDQHGGAAVVSHDTVFRFDALP
jgi:sugar lactone lactonase YvrE